MGFNSGFKGLNPLQLIFLTYGSPISEYPSEFNIMYITAKALYTFECYSNFFFSMSVRLLLFYFTNVTFYWHRLINDVVANTTAVPTER